MSFSNDPSAGTDPIDFSIALIEGDEIVFPLMGTLFCNDTITDATLDAKLIEHHAKMATLMKESILEMHYALEKLIQSLPESAAKPRAYITLQLDKLAAQLAGVDQTLANVITSTSTTTDVVVHLQETL
jgi:hypothetical protein